MRRLAQNFVSDNYGTIVAMIVMIMECKECYNELSRQTFLSSFGDMQIANTTSSFVYSTKP